VRCNYRRDEKKLKVADEIGAIPLSFDISDLKSITRQRGTGFIRRKIDTLVNNAGIGAFPALAKLQKTIY
jgi:3-oxoacyl-[acyl-carrier protein] reductase